MQTHPFGFKINMNKEMVEFVSNLSIGDKVDVLKNDNFVSNWTSGTVSNVLENKIEVHLDGERIQQRVKVIKKNSMEIDIHGTRSKEDF